MEGRVGFAMVSRCDVGVLGARWGWETIFRLIMNLRPRLVGQSSLAGGDKGREIPEQLMGGGNYEPTSGIGGISIYVATNKP